MKLQEGSNGQKLITVPRQIARAKGWDKGEELAWEVNDDGDLVLKETNHS